SASGRTIEPTCPDTFVNCVAPRPNTSPLAGTAHLVPMSYRSLLRHHARLARVLFHKPGRRTRGGEIAAAGPLPADGESHALATRPRPSSARTDALRARRPRAGA